MTARILADLKWNEPDKVRAFFEGIMSYVNDWLHNMPTESHVIDLIRLKAKTAQSLAEILYHNATDTQMRELGEQYQALLSELIKRFDAQLPLESFEGELARRVEALRVQAGCGLIQEDQENLTGLYQQLDEIGNKFQANLARAAGSILWYTVAELEEWGVPRRVIDRRESTDNPVFAGFNLGGTDTYLFLTHVTDQQARQEFLLARFKACEANLGLISEARRTGQEITQLIGLESGSHFALHDNVLGTYQEVEVWLEAAISAASDSLRDVLAQLEKHLGYPMQHWDLYRALDHLNSQEHEYPTITYEEALKNLFTQVQVMFGFTITVSSKQYNLWADGCVLYEVYAEDRFIGTIVMDALDRPVKWQGAATWYLADYGKYPIAVITGNWDPGAEMSLRDVELLWHEMGHALSWVLCENPFMSIHFRSDENEIPAMLFEMLASRLGYSVDPEESIAFGGVTPYQTLYNAVQLMMAQYSLRIFVSEGDPLDAYREVLNLEWIFPAYEGAMHPATLWHLVAPNYGPAYYAYMYAWYRAWELLSTTQGNLAEIGGAFKALVRHAGQD